MRIDLIWIYPQIEKSMDREDDQDFADEADDLENQMLAEGVASTYGGCLGLIAAITITPLAILLLLSSL